MSTQYLKLTSIGVAIRRGTVDPVYVAVDELGRPWYRMGGRDQQPWQRMTQQGLECEKETPDAE